MQFLIIFTFKFVKTKKEKRKKKKKLLLKVIKIAAAGRTYLKHRNRMKGRRSLDTQMISISTYLDDVGGRNDI